MNTRRRAAAGSGIVIGAALAIVAVGYPDWLWFPLFISFWLAVLTFVMSAVLEIRAHMVHA
jgi:uncharacterized membrane protein YccC